MRPAPCPKRRYVQLYLDLGQTNFSHTQCKVCGLLYAIGVQQDDKVHESFHKAFVEGIAFKGWKRERALQVAGRPDRRIVLVFPGDSEVHQRKVKEVAEVMEADLGLAEGWLLSKPCKVYMYVASSKIVGCLMAESITQAFGTVLIPPPAEALQNAGVPVPAPSPVFPSGEGQAFQSANRVFASKGLATDVKQESASAYVAGARGSRGFNSGAETRGLGASTAERLCCDGRSVAEALPEDAGRRENRQLSFESLQAGTPDLGTIQTSEMGRGELQGNAMLRPGALGCSLTPCSTCALCEESKQAEGCSHRAKDTSSADQPPPRLTNQRSGLGQPSETASGELERVQHSSSLGKQPPPCLQISEAPKAGGIWSANGDNLQMMSLDAQAPATNSRKQPLTQTEALQIVQGRSSLVINPSGSQPKASKSTEVIDSQPPSEAARSIVTTSGRPTLFSQLMSASREKRAKSKVLEEKQIAVKGEQQAMMCRSEAVRVACGVRAIWVRKAERRKGIATALLDAMRTTFVMGCVLEPSMCAFSQPTSDGRRLAARYCGTDTFLVY